MVVVPILLRANRVNERVSATKQPLDHPFYCLTNPLCLCHLSAKRDPWGREVREEGGQGESDAQQFKRTMKTAQWKSYTFLVRPTINLIKKNIQQTYEKFDFCMQCTCLHVYKSRNFTWLVSKLETQPSFRVLAGEHPADKWAGDIIVPNLSAVALNNLIHTVPLKCRICACVLCKHIIKLCKAIDKTVVCEWLIKLTKMFRIEIVKNSITSKFS